MSLTINYQLESITAASGVLALDGNTGALVVPKGTTVNRPSGGALRSGMLRFNTDTNLLEFYNGTTWTVPSSGSGQSVATPVSQNLHGLIVGNFVRFDSVNGYVLAQANAAANAEVVGVVSAVADANNFTLTTGGLITGLSGLTPGNTYFLSPVTPGQITNSNPVATGQISKPLVIAVTSTSGYFYNMRGIAVGGSGGGGGGSGVNLATTISQTAHGFTVGQVLALNGATYILARADNAADAEVVGIVTSVIDANDFTMTFSGVVTGLSGLIAGDVYFLSAVTPGAMTPTNPTGSGQISKPLLIASSTTAGYFYNMRGQIVGGDNTGVTPGTYLGLTVDAAGRITAEVPLVIAKQFTQLVGSNGTYALDSYAAFPYTITGVNGILNASGSITAQVLINGVAITGLNSIAVNTSPQNITATANNTVAVGNRVTVVFTSNSTSLGLEFSLAATRVQ